MRVESLLRSRLLLLAYSGLLVVACGEKSKRAELDGGPTSGDGAVANPGELPGGYKPRIACGRLGKGCERDDQCGDGLKCSVGNCLPDWGTCSEGCPAKAPLCAGSACVSPDELGCICATEEGKRDFLSCASLTADAPSCTPEQGLCDVDPDKCCAGRSCIQGTDANGDQLLGVCEVACNAHDECDTKCCAELPGFGGKFCAARDLCIARCRIQNEECDGDLRPCCEGMLCVTSESDPALNGCQIECTKNSECATGCCVLFGGGADNGVCGPTDRCDNQN